MECIVKSAPFRWLEVSLYGAIIKCSIYAETVCEITSREHHMWMCTSFWILTEGERNLCGHAGICMYCIWAYMCVSRCVVLWHLSPKYDVSDSGYILLFYLVCSLIVLRRILLLLMELQGHLRSPEVINHRFLKMIRQDRKHGYFHTLCGCVSQQMNTVK